MSHKIFHTEGIVLSSKDTRESDRFLTVFTKELGVIRATAQGIRKLESKLRYSLQDLSYANIDFVRGREVWRVTTASKIQPLVSSSHNTYATEVIANISRLLERLCQGEEKNELLYASVIESFLYLQDPLLTNDQAKNVELLTVLRIMYHLGYIGDIKNIEALTTLELTKNLIERIYPARKSIAAHINKSLKETHL
ncbi:DNA repair protein RecO [Candidatus Wolfebacteria bacterium]|nr:MAG: DNA repair protein RecO [Candidatus Wolfebacteria bacterium]